MESNNPGKVGMKSLSSLGAFTLSLGSAIGWGSFMLTNTEYLKSSGPIGSIIGLLIGMLIMSVLAFNYHCMINKYPENGGLYTYIKKDIRRQQPDKYRLCNQYQEHESDGGES